MKELTQLLLQAPDSQLDSSVKPLIEKWSNPPTALQILEVADKVVYGSLGSDFTVQVLNVVLEDAISREQTTLSEVVKQATWRDNP